MASYVELYIWELRWELELAWIWQILSGGHLVTEKKGSETDFFYWKLSHLGFGHSLAQFDFGFLQSFSKLLFSICSNCHSPSKLWLESSKSLKAFSRSDLNSIFSYLILNDGEDDIGENGGWCQYWKYPFLLQYVDNDHDDEEEEEEEDDGQGWWWGWWRWWWWCRG